MTTLLLDVIRFESRDRFDLQLSGERGLVLAEHSVELRDDDPLREAWLDFERASRDRARPSDFASRAGDWIGERILGPVGERLLERTPAVVRVRYPVDPRLARELALRPWELARVQTRWTAREGIVFLHEVPEEHGPWTPEAASELRILAVFPSPEGEAALGLREERRALEEAVERLVREGGRSIHLELVPWGASLERLQRHLQDEESWDILHIAGHGVSGALLVEDSSGRPLRLDAGGLVRLLRPARDRMRLVFLASCEGAAAYLAGVRESLGIEPGDVTPPEESFAASLATSVVEGLGVPVVAMRFPVEDAFAVRFTEAFYTTSLEGKGGIPHGLRIALGKSLSRAVSPASVGTPALFGRRAADVRLAAPRSTGAGFAAPPPDAGARPQSPPRFVGRASILRAASRALSRGSGARGVVLHGPPGIGKSALCAELLDVERRGFEATVYVSLEDRHGTPGAAFHGVLRAMLLQLPGFDLAPLEGRSTHVEQDLLRLRAFFRERRVLLAVENVEKTLRSDGDFGDAQLALVFSDLIEAGGASRFLLTSRVPVASLSIPTIVQLPVVALRPDESLLLLRDLPKLGDLLRSRPDLVRRALELAQGHPKLLELADGLADRPEALERLLVTRSSQLGSAGAEASFRNEGPVVDAASLLSEVETWARELARGLSTRGRRLLERLCALEPEDRDVETAGPLLGEADPPWTELEQSALVSIQGGRAEVHPLVVQALLEEEVRAAVSKEAGMFWTHLACVVPDEPSRNRDVAATAALRALPYLIRVGLVEEAIQLVELADVDRGRPSVQERIIEVFSPYLDRDSPAVGGTVGDALANRGRWTDGERLLRESLARAEEKGEARVAASIAADLSYHLREHGRLDEAVDALARARAGAEDLQVAETLVGIDAHEVQILRRMGRHEEAFRRTQELIATWPEGAPLTTSKLSILQEAAFAAMEIPKPEAWDWSVNAFVKLDEAAGGLGWSEYERARLVFGAHAPLIELGKLEDAEVLLDRCESAFRSAGDELGLAKVMAGRAHLELGRGRPNMARDRSREALLSFYRLGLADECAGGHNNLSILERNAGRGESEERIGHLVAAALLWTRMRSELRSGSIEELAAIRSALPSWAGSVAGIAARLGSDLAEPFVALLSSLASRSSDADLQALYREVEEVSARDPAPKGSGRLDRGSRGGGEG